MAGEVFPNAPLQFVVCEVAYPPAATDAPGLLEAVRAAVPDEDAVVTFAPPGVLRAAEGSEPEAAMFRLVAQKQTVAVTVWRRALVIEHSDYQHWADFKGLLEPVVAAVFGASKPPGVGRIGLRYVDEVHVPGRPTTLAEWSRYLHPALLWPTQFVDAAVVGAASGFSFQIGPHRAVNVRAAMTATRAMAGGSPLRLRDRPDTPGFVLDCDGFYQPSELDTSLDPAGIVKICGELHDVLDKLFQDAFTDAAREVFRGKEPT